MPPEHDSFLPRLQSVFYAVFDLKLGPKIVYQVPEGSISVTSATSNGNTLPISPIAPSSADVEPSNFAPDTQTTLPAFHSPLKRNHSSTRVLFHFDDISKYVIPHSALCGRLVTCATRRHRVIGFPAELHGPYERNYFRYNVCFVFDRNADLSCYEPIVRKVSRVLKSCEEESAFLSSPPTHSAIPSILEQLYEDLNSYSETSIPIDRFNSIELKIFPFYPNPPNVKNWMVPLALINLSKRVESNWDLTMQRVCKFIDGVNHVARIAQLADCDMELTRLAISHLLYHQVIMMIDIFQYSNMYTLQKSIQWLADEPHVREECGPYVTIPGKDIPDWPILLHLYSRLKPGTTVYEWMKSYDVSSLEIDVRRFTSFGVIKGFLRRVHRWPIVLQGKRSAQSVHSNDHGHSISSLSPPSVTSSNTFAETMDFSSPICPPSDFTARPSPGNETVSLTNKLSNSDFGTKAPRRTRKQSAAESILEQLRAKDASHIIASNTGGRRDSWLRNTEDFRNGSQSPGRWSTSLSQIMPSQTIKPSGPLARRRLSRSPSAQVLPTSHASSIAYMPPPALLPLLDGGHHTDELSVLFGVGWPILEHWLQNAGVGAGEGDYGQVVVVYM